MEFWAEASRTRVGRRRTRGQRLHCFGTLYCSQPAAEAAESNSLTTCIQPLNQAILLCTALLFGGGVLEPRVAPGKAGKIQLITVIDLYGPAMIRNNIFVPSVHVGRRRLHGTFYKLSSATCRVRVLVPSKTHSPANHNAVHEESGAIPFGILACLAEYGVTNP